MVENHDTEQRKRMVAGPDKYLAPLAKPRAGRKLKRVDQLWPTSRRAGFSFPRETLAGKLTG